MSAARLPNLLMDFSVSALALVKYFNLKVADLIKKFNQIIWVAHAYERRSICIACSDTIHFETLYRYFAHVKCIFQE